MMGLASSLVSPFFKTQGAFSTKSFASFSPKSVKALTSLMILIFTAASYFSSFKSKAVFSAAAAEATAGDPEAATDGATMPAAGAP
uniref:Uncharacterized protein n=1 Tax=Cajanus cajan TaxID=3821 RepID=A0A151TDJ4_CAJCA|nr:hypothetical protein KK1_011350 [Cajanus cajan]